jgi:hypothetical protein
MMEAVSTSEMSAYSYQTARRNIPEDSYLYVYCRCSGARIHIISTAGVILGPLFAHSLWCVDLHFVLQIPFIFSFLLVSEITR